MKTLSFNACFSIAFAFVCIIFFTACKKPKELTVKTLDATNISITTATLNGSYVKGDDPILKCGFAFKEESELQWERVELPIETFSYIVKDLRAETRYHVIAYVKTANESVEGGLKSFTTKSDMPR